MSLCCVKLNLKRASNWSKWKFFYVRKDVNFTSGCCKLSLFYGKRQNGFVEPRWVQTEVFVGNQAGPFGEPH